MREKSSENKRPAAVTEPNAMELSFVEIAEALDTGSFVIMKDPSGSRRSDGPAVTG